MILKNLTIISVILLLVPIVLGASASISQSGADTGTVMKSKIFTLTVSDLSGSGTATVTVPSGFSISEDTTKSFSGSSVSWTTFVADQKMSGKTISVLVSTSGSPSTATTSSFNVVLAPSLSVTPTPSSRSVVEAGSTFDLSINVQNTGETTAQNVVALISSTGDYTADSESQTIGSISASSSSSVVWEFTAAETQTLTITVTSSNADTETATVQITCTDCDDGSNEDDDDGDGGSGASNGFVSGNTTSNASKIPPGQEKKTDGSTPVNYPRGYGLVNNTKLLEAIEKVLAKGKLSERAKANMIEKAEVIRGDLDISRKLTTENGKTKIFTNIDYRGEKRVKNLMLHEMISKSIAENAANIVVKTQGRVDIVNPDPEYLITFPQAVKGSSFSIEYEVPGIMDEDVLTGMTTEVYVDALEEPDTETSGLSADKTSKFMVWLFAVMLIIAIALIIYSNVEKNDKIEKNDKNPPEISPQQPEHRTHHRHKK